MISDILSDAVAGLDHYLNGPFWDDTYCGDLRERIIRLRDEGKYVQILLDTHPCEAPPTEGVLRERIAAEEARSPRTCREGWDDQSMTVTTRLNTELISLSNKRYKQFTIGVECR